MPYLFATARPIRSGCHFSVGCALSHHDGGPLIFAVAMPRPASMGLRLLSENAKRFSSPDGSGACPVATSATPSFFAISRLGFGLSAAVVVHVCLDHVLRRQPLRAIRGVQAELQHSGGPVFVVSAERATEPTTIPLLAGIRRAAPRHLVGERRALRIPPARHRAEICAP